MRRLGSIIALWAAFAGQPAHAADDAQRKLIEQKLEFVGRLVSDSPAVQRIAESGNEQAKALFAAGTTQYGAAQAALRAGELAAADRQINQAIWSIGQARKLVPDSTRRLIHERVRFGQLLQSIDGLIASYRRHRARFEDRFDDDYELALEYLEQGKEFAATEQLVEANRALVQAEKQLLVGMSRMLGASSTIEYSLKFDSPAEEFGFELDRYRSFTELVPVALAELNPRREARALVDRYVERSTRMKDAALAQSKRGDYPAALASLREAIADVQRALTVAGLVTPQ